MLPFLSMCLNVRMLELKQLHFIHTTPLSYTTGLFVATSAKGTKPVSRIATE